LTGPQRLLSGIAILEKSAYPGGRNKGKGMNEANCHFCRIDPFMIPTRFAKFALSMLFIWVAGCVTQPHPDPLTNWKELLGGDYETVKQALADNYHDYIQNLPSNDEQYAGPIWLFEDGTGQHAVRFDTERNGTIWEHVLIYDKSNNREKVIRYYKGRYRS
jgi:hypothetical protein